jgi:predicted hydrocarbon binding protein
MKVKKRTITRNRKRAAGTNRTKHTPRPLQVTITAHEDYIKGRESAMLTSIINKDDSQRVPENAVLFISLLSNLTPGLSSVNRRAGMHVGRHLYSLLSAGKHYLLHEESVADLVKFFEHAGYSRITYNIFPDRIDIQMHDRSHEYIGRDLHSFEAGLISGFLTAAKKQYVAITEHECSNNGSPYCRFSSSFNAYREQPKEDTKAVLLRFAEHVARQSEKAEKASDTRISPEYYMLSASTVLESQYQEEMRHIASYIGSEVGASIFSNRSTKNPNVAATRVERVVRLLNLGKASVKSLKPIKIDISFDRLHSRSEFVELSLALINGLLKNHAVEGTRVSSEARHGAYLVRIIGKNPEK